MPPWTPRSRRGSRRPPTFIIAEAGVNHNGRVDLALRLVDAAARAGADAVKFQTFRADRLVTTTAQKAPYQRRTTPAGESHFDMLRRLELDEAAHRRIRTQCRRRRIEFLSTPFDEESADLLERLGVRRFKIGSGDLTNLLLLRHVARKGKPVLLSTGMSTLAEVRAAVRAIRGAGNPPLALLHCVSAYPAPAREANLRAVETLARAFHTPVGFSDHTVGLEVALAAVARGAAVLEKHLTLDRRLPGPDHHASLEPEEFAALVRSVRVVESALGDGRKRPMPSERPNRPVARRSLVLRRDVARGTRITPDLLDAKRPARGLSPLHVDDVVGRRARRALRAGARLRWGDLA